MKGSLGHFDYKFCGDLWYINKGEKVKAKKITIKAPTRLHLKEVLFIEQEYEKSQLKLLESMKNIIGDELLKDTISDNSKKTKEKEEEKEEVAVLKSLMSGGADVEKCLSCLETIFLSSKNGVHFAYVDDKEEITDTILEDFSIIDIKNLLGSYIVNFIIASPGN